MIRSEKEKETKKIAVCVDRTHDLQISRFPEVDFSLTLSQLS